jgi:hypothetical protein
LKKIIGIVFISLMFCNIGFAEFRLIERETVEEGHSFQTTCIDGYKFVAVYNSFSSGQTHRAYGAMGLSITQAFEERDGKSLPAKC